MVTNMLVEAKTDDLYVGIIKHRGVMETLQTRLQLQRHSATLLFMYYK